MADATNSDPCPKPMTLPNTRLSQLPGLCYYRLTGRGQNETIELSAEVRGALDFEDIVRFEHHIVETWKSIVRQPYNRRAELLQIAGHVANISAKHEGGDPEVEQPREHPSDILDYFRDKAEVVASGAMPLLERNYLDKHDAVNHTARALTESGLSFIAARRLHHARPPEPAAALA